jgi:Protein of unknown function, DUF481
MQNLHFAIYTKQMRQFCIILFFCNNVAFSQINESDVNKLQVSINITGNYQQGNVNILSLRNRLEFSSIPLDSVVFKSQNSSLYQEFSNMKSDFDIFSRNYLYYKPQRNFYPYAIGYISSNYRRKIESRYFSGLGLTYQLIKRPNHSLKISGNAVYEQTQFSENTFNFDTYNGKDFINVWRSSIFLSGTHYLFNRKIKLYYITYYQPSFNEAKNYRIQSDLGFDFPIWNGLAFNTLFTYTHENITITKVKKDDRILTFGLAYNFKKK